MAIVQNPIIGKASGSVGGVTFTTWKGKNVLKSKPTSVSNPDTPAQKTQRSKLTLIVSVYRLIAAMVVIGFENLAIGKSIYNAFVSQNIQDATLGSAVGPATLVPENLLVSKGTIGSTPITSVITEGTGDGIAVEFGAAIPVGGASTDLGYGLAYNRNKDHWYFSTVADARSEGAISLFNDLDISIGDVMDVYIFFKSATSSDVSDSTYLEYTVVIP